MDWLENVFNYGAYNAGMVPPPPPPPPQPLPAALFVPQNQIMAQFVNPTQGISSPGPESILREMRRCVDSQVTPPHPPNFN
jgi:hypothetical protein